MDTIIIRKEDEINCNMNMATARACEVGARFRYHRRIGADYEIRGNRRAKHERIMNLYLRLTK